MIICLFVCYPTVTARQPWEGARQTAAIAAVQIGASYSVSDTSYRKVTAAAAASTASDTVMRRRAYCAVSRATHHNGVAAEEKEIMGLSGYNNCVGQICIASSLQGSTSRSSGSSSASAFRE
jgi:hypothetical protein